MAFDLGRYSGRRFGLEVVALRGAADVDRYNDALDAFTLTGDRAALFESLFALGVPADQIRRVAAGESLAILSR